MPSGKTVLFNYLVFNSYCFYLKTYGGAVHLKILCIGIVLRIRYQLRHFN